MSTTHAPQHVDILSRWSKGQLIACLTAAALSASVLETSASPIITAVPSSSSVLLNGLITVDFVLDDFDDLSLFQMGVDYDASRLSLVGNPAEGPHPGGGTSFFSGDTSTPGQIRFIANAVSGLTGVNGGGTLFSVQFQAIAIGDASIVAVFKSPIRLSETASTIRSSSRRLRRCRAL